MAERRRAAAEAEPTGTPLHVRHRPARLDDVVGQDEVVRSLRAALKSKDRQHTFFFLGPSGCGKTTLARIVAAEFGCSPENVVEVDAASTSGIDDMRSLTESMRYAGFGEKRCRAYIIDECHALSKQAWDSLLKSTEEPPEHAFFLFCSTNPSKIPATMLTRGPQYALQAVRRDDLYDLLDRVCAADGIDAPDWMLDAVVGACGGSPRQALVMLAMVRSCETPDEAAALLQGQGETKEVIDLCRRMVRGEMRWRDVVDGLRPIAELGAEGIRIQVTLYLSAVLMNPKGASNVGALLDMLDAFSQPCNPTDKMAPLLLAFGRFADFGGGR